MRTWQDLIERFGGAHEYARQIGVTAQTARQQASRNNVHSKYWSVIVARAPQAGIQGITFELLASLECGRDAVSPDRFPEPGRPKQEEMSA